MDVLEIDDILQDGIQLLFAADQEPFEVSGAVFCVLVPLIGREGQHLGDRDANFPHRGRIWWMLRTDIRAKDVRPGTVWTGRIESAPKQDKDVFQAVRSSVTAGAKDWIEVLDVDERDPDPAYCCRGSGLPLARQPLKVVLVRGSEYTYGPLLATHRDADDTVELRALNAGDPVVHRFRTAELDAALRVERFQFECNLHDPHASVRRVRLALVRAAAFKEVVDRGLGETVDAQSEAQLVKWALGLAGYTKAQSSQFRSALESLPMAANVVDSRERTRLDRFRRLCQDAEHVATLGTDVATALAESEPLRELVQDRITEVARQQIEEQVRAANDQIVRQTEQARRNKELAESELQRLEVELEHRRRDLHERFEAEHADLLQSLDERDARLAERERELERKQRELGESLGAIVQDYRDHGDAIARQVLTYLPFLGLGQPAARRAAEPDAKPRGAGLPVPPWLEARVEPAQVDQLAFLDQLRRVVERRGYVFQDHDLVNFHVSMLVGAWTVVSGATGVGKSSLPRLYAEALGMADRYLKVPVQPDWLDDRDVLGAYNSLSERFEPASSGLVEHLIHAERDMREQLGGIYLVCLDEMNLSRVEHYFARFLSILEDPPERRRLTILGRGVGSRSDPYTAHREIAIAPNVRLIGTVNVDETTHFFSPKVLDRALLLTFEQPDLSRAVAAGQPAAELVVEPVDLATWSSWARSPGEVDPAARELVLSLHDVLRGIQSGLGYRLRDRIFAFLATARGLLDDRRALDLAFAQTALPRLRTHHPGFTTAAERLLRLLPEDRYPRSGRILTALKESGGSHDFFQLL
ncbi:MAG: hypothetical protein IPM29_00775 [Planctomycetes bacterium]|nr:hypothetical protein [Planctomycetota bacterium]